MDIRDRLLQGSPKGKGTVTTTNATPTALVPNKGILVMPNNTTWAVTVRVVARRTYTGTESNGYFIQGVVRRGANAGSTTIVGTALSTGYEDTAAWDAVLAVDTTAGGVKVTVTGEAAKTVNWAAQFSYTQVQ